MAYDLSTLNSAAECDELERTALRDKEVAQNKKANLVFQGNQSAGTNQSRGFGLQQAQADMINVQAQQAAEIPQSVDWKKLEAKRKTLEARIYTLELNRSISTGVNNIERQYEINVLDAQIAEADALIAAAQTRKAALV